jgi:hypothetical protein
MISSYKFPLRFLAASLLVGGLSFASIANAAKISITVEDDPKTGADIFPMHLNEIEDSEITVRYIKDRIEDQTGFPHEEQILSFDGKELEDKNAAGKENTMKDYKIGDKATLRLKLK